MFDLRVLGVKRLFSCTCFSLIFCSLFNHTATFRRESDYPLSTHFIKDLKDWTETPAVSITEKNRSVTDTYTSDVHNCPKNVTCLQQHTRFQIFLGGFGCDVTYQASQNSWLSHSIPGVLHLLGLRRVWVLKIFPPYFHCCLFCPIDSKPVTKRSVLKGQIFFVLVCDWFVAF